MRSKLSFCLGIVLSFLSFLFFPLLGSAGEKPILESSGEKPIVVVVPSYNNEQWFSNNLESIYMQKYSNFRVIYVNDCSKDQTRTNVTEWFKNKGIDARFVDFDPSSKSEHANTLDFMVLMNSDRRKTIVVNNKQRSGAFANLIRMIYSCDDTEIMLTLDGDDWFAHDQVLSRLNKVYSTRDVWLTHGTLMEWPSGHVAWCEPVPKSYIERNAFREFKCPSHLRTFYAGLFKRIKWEDLFYKGKCFPMAWDMTMMFPMIEMARERHAFIKDVNYIYNTANSINDNKVDPDLQNECDRVMRGKRRYKRLDQLHSNSEYERVRKAGK